MLARPRATLDEIPVPFANIPPGYGQPCCHVAPFIDSCPLSIRVLHQKSVAEATPRSRCNLLESRIGLAGSCGTDSPDSPQCHWSHGLPARTRRSAPHQSARVLRRDNGRLRKIRFRRGLGPERHSQCRTQRRAGKHEWTGKRWKMKEHHYFGVTLSIKNCYGMTPLNVYEPQAGIDEPSTEVTGTRVNVFHAGIRLPSKSAPQELDPSSLR